MSLRYGFVFHDMEEMVPEDQRHRWIRAPAKESSSRVDKGLELVKKKLEELRELDTQMAKNTGKERFQ